MKNETTEKDKTTASAETAESASEGTSAKGKSKDRKSKETAPETSANDAATAFGVIKGKTRVQSMPLEQAAKDLRDKYTDAQIEQMVAQNKMMPSAKAVYCADKKKLKAYIEKKGWGTPQAVAGVKVEDAPMGGDTSVWALSGLKSVNELQVGDEVVGADGETHEIVDLTDPNQAIYDAAQNDEAFAASLNKTEKEVLRGLIDGSKTPASLGITESRTFESIKAKFAGRSDDGQEPLDNFRAPNTPSMALAKDDAIDAIPEIPDDAPMTDEEKELRDTTVQEFLEAKAAFEQSPRVMMEKAALLRHNKLYRETHDTFEQFALEELKLTREYAQNLAQFGDFLAALNSSPISENPAVTGSINAVKRLTVNTNKIARQLGIETSDFEVMKPIIQNMAEIVADLTTDENGEVLPNAPRIVAGLNDVLREVVNRNVVEIEGENMTVEEAQKKGVLGHAVISQTVETVAEGIKANRQTIIDDARRRAEKRTQPHSPATPRPSSKEQFVGAVPVYKITCDNPNHADINKKNENRVVKVFNAGFGLFCSCMFQELTTSPGVWVCIETDGLTVQHD